MSHASRAKSRALSALQVQVMPTQKYSREGHIVKQLGENGENDTVLFTGLLKLKDGSSIPNISAAKRHVRTVLRPKYGELRVS